MKNNFILFVGLCFSVMGFAQTDTSVSKPKFINEVQLGLAAAANDGQLLVALDAKRLYGIGKNKKRFEVGYGVRFNSFVGGNQNYTTAPAKFTSPVQGPTTIFSETIENNIDTLAFVNSNVFSLNTTLYFQYRITPKLFAGFNIDLLGFSFGSPYKASVISSTYDLDQSPVVTAKPTALNLLLTSDNDIGSLNSEFSLGYQLNSKWSVRGGFSFYFAEYQTENKLMFNNGTIANDRYRLKAGMALLAVNFKPFKK